MVSTGEMFGLIQVVIAATYFGGDLVLALPIPYKEVKAWSGTLRKDAIVSEFALLSVDFVQVLESWLSQAINQSIPGPFSSEPVAMTAIMAQLVALDSAILLLISALTSTVILAPIANVLANALGPAITWITAAIILWAMIQTLLSILPQVWPSVYLVGIFFFAWPLRIGRRFGCLLMSSSIVVAIGLPWMPGFAILFERVFGYDTAIGPLQNILSQMRNNPLLIGKFIATLPQALAGLLAAVILGLIVFPSVYLFVLSLITRNVATLLGGSSGGPLVSDYMPFASRDLSSTIVRSEDQ